MPCFLLQQISSGHSWRVYSSYFARLDNPNYRNIVGGSNVAQNIYHRQDRKVQILVIQTIRIGTRFLIPVDAYKEWLLKNSTHR
jgi:hypothetical protein